MMKVEAPSVADSSRACCYNQEKSAEQHPVDLSFSHIERKKSSNDHEKCEDAKNGGDRRVSDSHT